MVYKLMIRVWDCNEGLGLVFRVREDYGYDEANCVVFR